SPKSDFAGDVPVKQRQEATYGWINLIALRAIFRSQRNHDYVSWGDTGQERQRYHRRLLRHKLTRQRVETIEDQASAQHEGVVSYPEAGPILARQP
ncbi:hypothetical protein N7449_009847, partial [Penicillium cf. viridicatum]